jgi:hypothetical protein
MKPFSRFFAVVLCSFVASADPAEESLKPITPDSPFSFVVFGDNRGDASGLQPSSFREVLASVKREEPSLILDSGDMIYGHVRAESYIRTQWHIYRQTVKGVRAPMFHVPGNHDLWNAKSARIYRELWGRTYYAFTYANSRFIALDTETTPARLSAPQVDWLRRELQVCRLPNIFLFMHRPLFPIDGGIGSSLDAYPQQRDQLHQLFMQYRDRIRSVFSGHEHLYSYQQRDGIAYYTSGGGGAPLYMAPERGGFHHFLKVQVDRDQVNVEVHKVCAPRALLMPVRQIVPGEILESWNQGLLWFAWDRTANVEIVDSDGSQGRRALRLNFDLTQYAWPVLVLPFTSPRDFSDVSSVLIDVYIPNESGTNFTLALAAQGVEKRESIPVTLKSGWNTVETRLLPSWLPAGDRRRLTTLEWSWSTTDQEGAGYVLFDNLRIQHTPDHGTGKMELVESWERPLLWRIFDESVSAEVASGADPSKAAGLLLHQDWANCRRPVIFAQLNPPWDLSRVKALLLTSSAGNSAPKDLVVRLVLRANDTDYVGPGVALERGARELRFDLAERWLPANIRARVEQVAFVLETTDQTARADLLFQQFRAASNP